MRQFNFFGMLDENHNVIPCNELDLPKMEAFRTDPKRWVGKTFLGENDRYMVLTVFLMIDHGWGGNPRWFETMVFDEITCEWGDQVRYETWAEAEIGHKEMVEIIQKRIAEEALSHG